jgi:micrococcal nuclease
MLYQYKGIVTKIYDADTITVDIDLGFSIWMKDQVFRLAGINAPEVKGVSKDAGIKARDVLRQWIPIGSEILLITEKDKKEKYGRYLAKVYIDPKDKSVNERLILEGYAVPYME